MSARPPILIVSYTFPPYRGIGGRRWAKFAKALARRGHPVHVIHSAGADELKGSLWTADAATPGLHTHALPQRYPTVLFRRPLRHAWEKVSYRIWSRLLPLATRGNWYDKSVFWRGQFLEKAGELIQQHGIRDVIITGAPFRLCAFGVALKERHGIRLTCDLRDPWTWQDTYGAGALSATRRAYEAELEATMMSGSDHITTPHPSIIEHLRANYPHAARKLYLLPHALDPDELGTPGPPPTDGDFRMIYAGSMKGGERVARYFEELIKAFERLRQQAPEQFLRTSFDLHITGHDVAPYVQAIRQKGLAERIRFHAPLPPAELARRISDCHAVLIYLPPLTQDLLGTKFNELFHLQRPVVLVGEPSIMGEHIRSHGLGITIALEDLVEQLPKVITRAIPLPTDPNYDLSAYLLPQVTERFAQDLLDG